MLYAVPCTRFHIQCELWFWLTHVFSRIAFWTHSFSGLPRSPFTISWHEYTSTWFQSYPYCGCARLSTFGVFDTPYFNSFLYLVATLFQDSNLPPSQSLLQSQRRILSQVQSRLNSWVASDCDSQIKHHRMPSRGDVDNSQTCCNRFCEKKNERKTFPMRNYFFFKAIDCDEQAIHLHFAPTKTPHAASV